MRLGWRIFAIGLVLLASPFSRQAIAEQTEIPIWSYYQNPPFVTGKNQGLSYDFIRLLNEHSSDNTRYRLHLMPRKRVDQKLRLGEKGAVLFVHGSWLGDPDHSRNFWSKVLLKDRNILIFQPGSVTTYQGDLHDLRGFVFGGVLGRHYQWLSTMVANGLLTRIDAGSELQNLSKLQHQRIDFTTMPESVFLYLKYRLSGEEHFPVAEVPLLEFSRHLMVPLQYPELKRSLFQSTESALQDPEWQVIKENYGLAGSLH